MFKLQTHRISVRLHVQDQRKRRLFLHEPIRHRLFDLSSNRLCTSCHYPDEKTQSVVYNAMIRGFVHCSSLIQALQLYLEMLRAHICPISYTFSSIVKGCALISAFQFGESVHGQILKNGFASHLFVQTALVDFYSNLCKMVEARRVFDEMPERDVFAWTMMVSPYARVRNLGSARRLFDEMPERNCASWNTMIDGYVRVRDVESAKLLFNEMPKRDLISWTTMINCYSRISSI